MLNNTLVHMEHFAHVCSRKANKQTTKQIEEKHKEIVFFVHFTVKCAELHSSLVLFIKQSNTKPKLANWKYREIQTKASPITTNGRDHLVNWEETWGIWIPVFSLNPECWWLHRALIFYPYTCPALQTSRILSLNFKVESLSEMAL